MYAIFQSLFVVYATFTYSVASFNGFNDEHCPAKCKCSSHLKRVSCISVDLWDIPQDIPTSVTELFLSRNRLTQIHTNAFQKLVNLTTLSLEYNKIDSIEDDAFNGLRKLKSLLLRQNLLTSLKAEVFQDLVALKNLYITNNFLQGIPDLRFATNLTYLTLDNNRLKSAKFAPGFANLTLLSTLILSNNPDLASITNDDFESLNSTSVRKIDVSRCPLKDIGDKVFHFVHLQSVVLSHIIGWDEKFLRRLFHSLENCSELTSLDLSGVINVTTLPVDIFSDLSRVPLKHLNLAHTSSVDMIANGTFSYFHSLEQLDLSSSSFSIIHDDMTSLKKLSQLKLHSNKGLRNIPHINVPSLKQLYLRDCPLLSQLNDRSFVTMPNLEELYLSNCGIGVVQSETFIALGRLRILDMSKNQIGGSNLPVALFKPLNSLVQLDLSSNKLTTMPTESGLFNSLLKLRSLNMRDNQCNRLPDGIFSQLQSLTSLDLSGNKLGEMMTSNHNTPPIFHDLETLEMLHLMKNEISFVSAELLRGCRSLRMVNLSHNSLADLGDVGAFNASGNLTGLDLTGNKISVVSETAFSSLPPNTQLNISDNPFACWCDMIWFRRWITSHNTSDSKLPGLRSYKCNSPTEMAGKLFIDFDPEAIALRCFPPPWIIILVSVTGGVVIAMIFIITIIYRYRWSLRLKIYRVNQRIHRLGGPGAPYQRVEEAFDYHVLVSYHDSDEDWVRGTLIPCLRSEGDNNQLPINHNRDDVAEDGALAEQPTTHFGLDVFSEDDIQAGTLVIGGIADAMERSEKVLLVISKNYLKDGRRKYEVEMALNKSADDVVLLLYEDNADVRLPAELRPKLDEAVHWTPDSEDGQRLFWRQLHDKLRPHTEQ